MRASYSSLFGSDQFVMEFSNKTLKQFYMNMPQNFMGLPNRGESRTESQQHAAIVRKATCSTTNQAGWQDCQISIINVLAIIHELQCKHM